MTQVLLYIMSDDPNCVDECLIVVPEDYDEDEVLGRVIEDDVVRQPRIAEEIEIPKRTNISDNRPYYG